MTNNMKTATSVMMVPGSFFPHEMSFIRRKHPHVWFWTVALSANWVVPA
jgi:hypothetical protein